MTATLLDRRRLLLAALGAASAGARAAADDGPGVEYQVKAAFVCKFGNYIDWPPQALGAAGDPFRIGVLASATVADEFRRTAAAASVAGRQIEVRKLARGDAPDGLQLLFVSRAMSAHAAELLAALQGRPVLTVTELDPGGATGMINFVVVEDKVRFDILLPTLAQSGLKISVRLLSVARRVEGART
ncbi:hypothetical protein J2X16_002113 [Pelomonas aquatica]|uniref:DUF4154 domain-containing protein n=1 Tax=Pelomonas aquatica TaxID=431058 RepID=A0ABU1ZAP0_9BURK|nr:YfiR family protein [Pelomonas aquatica]MDR7296766.1 hypothetical protein [Pelomonas aquatica]